MYAYLYVYVRACVYLRVHMGGGGVWDWVYHGVLRGKGLCRDACSGALGFVLA